MRKRIVSGVVFGLALTAGAAVNHVNDNVIYNASGNNNVNNKVPKAKMDGWIVVSSHYYTQPIGRMDANFVVPKEPVVYDKKSVVFFFTGLMRSDGRDLLQPVLQYGPSSAGGKRGKWSLGAWHILPDHSAVNSKLISAKTGDKVYTSMYSKCENYHSCNWTIYIKNNTTNQEINFKTHSDNKTTLAVANVLETYGVNHCSMLPKTEFVMTNIKVWDRFNSNITPAKWDNDSYMKNCNPKATQDVYGNIAITYNTNE